MVKYNVYRLGLDVPGPKHNFRLYGDVVWWLGRLSLTLFDLELVWGTILFGMGTWIGDSPLIVQFLNLFQCGSDQRALVRSYSSREGNQVVWGPVFRRNLAQVEESQFLNIIGILGNTYIPNEGDFSVPSFKVLSGEGYGHSVIVALGNLKVFLWVLAFG